MKVYSGAKIQSHGDVMCDDTGNAFTNKYAEDGGWQHEETVLKLLTPHYAGIVIPNAGAVDFMVVTEWFGNLFDNIL